MKIKIVISLCIAALAVAFAACGGGTTTPAANNANANKPANANTNTSSNANANGAKKEDKGKPIADSKKPEGASKAANKKVAVPESWIYVYDSAKGYGFSLPEGSTGGMETQGGVDTFLADTPAPSEITVVVIAFKDKEMTKEDLLDVAEKFLEGLGAKVTTGELKAESEDYYLCEASAVGKEGNKSKMKILVGTDVTDNYVMILGAEEAKFAANEAIMNQIWGSFEMWSGGASGTN